MDATITLVKQNVTQAQVDALVAKATQAGWTVEWDIKGKA